MIVFAEGLRSVVRTSRGTYVAIDTCYTMDCGWESMAFECDAKGNIASWNDLDRENYVSMEEAFDGHERMVNKWKEEE